MAVQRQLPQLRPMLARASPPFDSDDFCFEIKWDGIRALVYVDRDGLRIVSRQGHEITAAFPELHILSALPAGTVLDGELVVLRQGRPQLNLVQGRKSLRSAQKIHWRAVTTPATYVIFDQLFAKFEPLLNRPLEERRQILFETIERLNQTQLLYSEGVVGSGRELYQQVVVQGLEGVVAKRRDSLYQPGKRNGAWLKIKPPHGLKVHASVPTSRAGGV